MDPCLAPIGSRIQTPAPCGRSSGQAVPWTLGNPAGGQDGPHGPDHPPVVFQQVGEHDTFNDGNSPLLQRVVQRLGIGGFLEEAPGLEFLNADSGLIEQQLGVGRVVHVFRHFGGLLEVFRLGHAVLFIEAEDAAGEGGLAGTADGALVHQQHLGAGIVRLDGREDAGHAAADHQHLGGHLAQGAFTGVFGGLLPARRRWTGAGALFIAVWASFECRSTDYCIVMCSNGRVCSVPVSALPGGRGDGVPLTTLIELAAGARIVQVLCGNASQSVLWATAAGYGFSCTLGDMLGRNKAGKQFISVENEAILPPVLFTPNAKSMVAAVSKLGRLLVFSLLELKVLGGGGKGVIVMGLAEGDALAALTVLQTPALQVTLNAGAREQVVKLSGDVFQGYLGKRARGGKIISLKSNFRVVSITGQS